MYFYFFNRNQIVLNSPDFSYQPLNLVSYIWPKQYVSQKNLKNLNTRLKIEILKRNIKILAKSKKDLTKDNRVILFPEIFELESYPLSQTTQIVSIKNQNKFNNAILVTILKTNLSILVFIFLYPYIVGISYKLYLEFSVTFNNKDKYVTSYFFQKEPNILYFKDNKLKLEDFKGFEYLPEELKFFCDKVKNEQIITNYPKFLIVGSDGSGKKFLVKALAGELKMHLLKIAPYDLFDIDPINEIVIPQTKIAKYYFKYLKRIATPKIPVLLFFDNFEITGFKRIGVEDSINSNLSSNTTTGSIDLFIHLLVEIDGLTTKKSNNPILLMAATTNLSRIDPALKRPGRFDNFITLSNPNLQTRQKLIITTVDKLNIKISSKTNRFISISTNNLTTNSLIWSIKTCFYYSLIYSPSAFEIDLDIYKTINKKMNILETKIQEKKAVKFINELNKFTLQFQNKNTFVNRPQTNSILNKHNLIDKFYIEFIDFIIEDCYFIDNPRYKTIGYSLQLELVNKQIYNYLLIFLNKSFHFNKYEKQVLSNILLIRLYNICFSKLMSSKYL